MEGYIKLSLKIFSVRLWNGFNWLRASVIMWSSVNTLIHKSHEFLDQLTSCSTVSRLERLCLSVAASEFVCDLRNLLEEQGATGLPSSKLCRLCHFL